MGREAGETLLGTRGRNALATMRAIAEKTGVDATGEHGEFHTAVSGISHLDCSFRGDGDLTG